MKIGVMRSKKGDIDLMYTVMFLVLNFIFFTTLLAFVYRASTGTLVYEQLYAKQIAFAIDEAVPGMKIFIEMREGFEIAKKNKVTNTDFIVRLKDSKVLVRLGKEGGYFFSYFSNYKIEKSFKGNVLVLEVSEYEK